LVLILAASFLAAILGWNLPLLLPLAYLSACAVLGIYAGKRVQLGGHLAMLAVLPTMHLFWGVGFIAGFAFRAKPKTSD
jgi:hypothetical protein